MTDSKNHDKPEPSNNDTNSAVVLVIDQLPAWLLGPYGNTWFDASNFNRLAGQSMLFDMCVTDTPDLKRAYRGMWLGGHAMQESTPEFFQSHPHLVERLDDWGVRTTLAADDSAQSTQLIKQFEIASAFDRHVEIPINEPTRLATSISDAYLTQYFAQAVELVAGIQAGDLIWLHCQGLAGPWDAPYSLRQHLADEEDPDPPKFLRLPESTFDAAQDDPDLILGYQQSCLAQVMMLDQLLGLLLDELPDETLFCLTSTRGIPLGEHSVVGSAQTLYQEVTHVPLFIRTPETAANFGSRSQRLVHPQIIRDVLIEWFATGQQQLDFKNDWMNPIDHDRDEQAVFCAELDAEKQIVTAAIQTRDWKYIRDCHPDGQSDQSKSRSELYSKPDDRWEINNVADRGWADAKPLKRRLQEERERYLEKS